MKQVIRDAGSYDFDFLENELNLMDMFWDSFNSKLEKMKKYQLKELYEKAKQSEKYQQEQEYIKNEEAKIME